MPYATLCQKLGYQFENQNLLIQALTRTSAFNVCPDLRKNGDYQRLEFIGDKILGQIISDILFDHHPDWTVGQLTTAVASFVNNNGPLAEIANSLELGSLLFMDQGEEHNNFVRTNIKALSDATEALIGAVWIDSNKNYPLLRQIILKHWNPLGLLPSIKFQYEFEDYLFRIDRHSKFFSLEDEKYAKQLSLLLERPCEQNVLNEALVEAIFAVNSDLVDKLLQKGADANFVYPNGYWGRYDNCDCYPVSALQIATTQDVQPFLIIKSLLAHGANPNWNQDWFVETISTPSSSTITLSDMFRHVSSPIFSATPDKPMVEPKKIFNSRTVLHELATWPYGIRDLETKVELLLDAGADLTLENFEGKTCIDLASDPFDGNAGLLKIAIKYVEAHPEMHSLKLFKPLHPWMQAQLS